MIPLPDLSQHKGESIGLGMYHAQIEILHWLDMRLDAIEAKIEKSKPSIKDFADSMWLGPESKNGSNHG